MMSEVAEHKDRAISFSEQSDERSLRPCGGLTNRLQVPLGRDRRAVAGIGGAGPFLSATTPLYTVLGDSSPRQRMERPSHHVEALVTFDCDKSLQVVRGDR